MIFPAFKSWDYFWIFQNLNVVPKENKSSLSSSIICKRHIESPPGIVPTLSSSGQQLKFRQTHKDRFPRWQAENKQTKKQAKGKSLLPTVFIKPTFTWLFRTVSYTLLQMQSSSLKDSPQLIYYIQTILQHHENRPQSHAPQINYQRGFP